MYTFNVDNFRPYYPTVDSSLAQIYLYNCASDSFATVVGNDTFTGVESFVKSGDKILVTAVNPLSELAFSGTFLYNGTTLTIAWDNVARYETQLADISTASTVYFPNPQAGVINLVYGIQWGAVTSSNSAIAFSIGTTAITGGTFTITTSGSAGTYYSAVPTALNVTSGSNYVKAATDGASSTTAIATLGYQIVFPSQV